MHTRPQPVTVAVVLLALLSLLNFVSPLLPTDYPTIVLFLGGALGVVGLLAAVGLWMLRRWGLLLTIIVSVLNIVLAAPGIAVEPHATGKLLAGVTAVGFALIIMLVMRLNSRRAFAATRVSENAYPTRERRLPRGRGRKQGPQPPVCGGGDQPGEPRCYR